jgi:hypothetical protein
LTTAIITARAGASTATATIQILPPVPKSVAVYFKNGTLNSSGNVRGGTQTPIKVTLSQVAFRGQTVSLTSSNPELVRVPATLTFDGESAEYSFDIDPGRVSQATTVNIVATSGQTSVTGSIRVVPPSITRVSLTPSTATGGQEARFNITLDSEAPASGFGGVITTTNPDLVRISQSFLVPGERNFVAVPFQVARVETSASATITAGANGVKQNALLTVEPEGPSGVSTSPTSVIGGAKVVVTVTRVATPEPLTVVLSSNNAAAAVPSSITFGPNSTSEQFTIVTAPVPSQTSATISAKKGAVVMNGSIRLDPPAVTQLTLSPSSTTSGQAFTAQFSINRPAPPGLVVRIKVQVGFQEYIHDAAVPVNAMTGSIRLVANGQSSANHVIASTSSGSQTATLTILSNQ